ncbi:MAG: hypothetical protein L3K06_02565 [Thermoplasmata archaeon]|nr:hypothetical protein [Thermoplasmata archaeon]
MTPNPDAPVDEPLDWRTVVRGALVGLAVIVPVTIVRVVLDREMTNFDDSGWVYPLFVLVLVGFFAAGWVAGRARPTVPLTHGSLAGAGTLVLWIPIRIVIWAIREDGRGLFSGTKAALAPGQVFGDLIIAAALGMLGAWLGSRSRLRRSVTT